MFESSRNWISLFYDLSHLLYPIFFTYCYKNGRHDAAPEIKFIKQSKMLNQKNFTCDLLKISPK